MLFIDLGPGISGQIYGGYCAANHNQCDNPNSSQSPDILAIEQRIIYTCCGQDNCCYIQGNDISVKEKQLGDDNDGDDDEKYKDAVPSLFQNHKDKARQCKGQIGNGMLDIRVEVEKSASAGYIPGAFVL